MTGRNAPLESRLQPVLSSLALRRDEPYQWIFPTRLAENLSRGSRETATLNHHTSGHGGIGAQILAVITLCHSHTRQPIIDPYAAARLPFSHRNWKPLMSQNRKGATPRREFLKTSGKIAATATLLGDVVILATPPAFRWVHFTYAIQKGINVFMEKPVTVDGPTTRRMIELAKKADEKNLKVGVGLMVRHCRGEYLDQNLDTYSVEYTYPDGSKLFYNGRTMSGCHNEFVSYVHGSKGSAIVSTSAHAPGKVRSFKDQTLNCEHEFAPNVNKMTEDGPAPVTLKDGVYPVAFPGMLKTEH